MMPVPEINYLFDALGTKWSVQQSGTIKRQTQITNKLASIDKRWSRFRSDSMVARMGAKAGTYRIDPSEYSLMKFYQSLAEITNGRVTPFIASALEDLGYDASYTLRDSQLRRYKPQNFNDILDLQPESLVIKQPTLIDVGAAGKGYAIDQIAEGLSDEFIIDASGDILVRGSLLIGLEHPTDHAKIIGSISLKDQAICASSIYRRSWGDYHHILDGHTGQPVRDVVATWAVASSAMIADGLATALFFNDPDTLRPLGLQDYCIIRHDGAITTPNRTNMELFVS